MAHDIQEKWLESEKLELLPVGEVERLAQLELDDNLQILDLPGQVILAALTGTVTRSLAERASWSTRPMYIPCLVSPPVFF